MNDNSVIVYFVTLNHMKRAHDSCFQRYSLSFSGVTCEGDLLLLEITGNLFDSFLLYIVNICLHYCKLQYASAS